MADSTVAIDVGVMDRGDEACRGRKHRVAITHLNVEEECATSICTIGRTYNVSACVK